MTIETSATPISRRAGMSALAIATAGVAAAAMPVAATAADSAQETPASMVGALHSAFGQHHARAVHAKGIILQGTFTPAPQAKELSQAKVFASGTVPVTVRFSDFTGIPDIPDTVGDANPRGFAVKFRLPGDQTLDLVTHSFNGFPTRNSDEFAQLLRAIGASGGDAAKPTELDKFLASHPIAKTFLTTQKPPPVSYGTLSYFGVNAFAFVDASQHRRNVRYRFVPLAGEQFLDAKTLATKGPSYLQEEITSRVTAAPIAFDWYAQVAQAGDVADDPSIAWPESRQLVKLGTVTIDKIDAEPSKTDKGLLFLPGALQSGIEIVDPMIAMRSAAYPISFGERQ
jgi:catalase